MIIIDRLIFLLAAMGFFFLASFSTLFAFNMVPGSALTDFISRFYDALAGRIDVGVLGLLLFFAGVRLGQLSLFNRGKKTIVIQETALGEVKVSLTAVENLIFQLLRPIPEIREAKPFIKGIAGKPSVLLKLVIIPETNLPELTKRIQNLVQEGVLDILGIKISQVKVLVDSVLREKSRVE